MAALLATSILVTHPKETFAAITGLGKAAYNFAESGLDMTAATIEASIALAAKIAETLADNEYNIEGDWEIVDNADDEIEMTTLSEKNQVIEPLGGNPVETFIH